MITLTRRRARCLRGLLRCPALGLPRTGPVPPLVLRAEGGRLRAQYRYGAVAVEHASDGPREASGALAIPLGALAELEGRDEVPVALEPAGPGRVVARWHDRGVPAVREFDAPDAGPLPAMPGPPDRWHDVPAGLLDAIAAACAVTGEDSSRYALSCLRLRGGPEGGVAATDGRQLLIVHLAGLPWDGDRLVGRLPALARPVLPRNAGVAVGLAGDAVALRAGPWTLWLAARAGVRYPDLDRVVPAPGAATTRLRLDPADARTLADALGRLPGGEGGDGPVTLDLGDEVLIRARGESGPPAELALARSADQGPPARVATPRACLALALAPGLAEIEVAGAGAPLCARDGRRAYAWQPPGEEEVVGPSSDATRVAPQETPTPSPARARVAAPATPARHRGGTPAIAPRPTPSPAPARAEGGRPLSGAPVGMAGLIEQAVALHGDLARARARAARLVAALRAGRRRSRALAGAPDQIRQLRLQDVAV